MIMLMIGSAVCQPKARIRTAATITLTRSQQIRKDVLEGPLAFRLCPEEPCTYD